MSAWSDSETDTLIRMWPKASAAQIASHLHRSRASVCRKAQWLRQNGLLPPDVEKHFEVDPWWPGGARPELRYRAADNSMPSLGHRVPNPVPPDLEALQMRPCALAELDDGRCHWPLGRLEERATLFCGGVTEAGRRYCAHHRLRGTAHLNRPAPGAN